MEIFRLNNRYQVNNIFEVIPENLILSDEFLQISIRSSSQYTYGIGEQGKQKFKRNFDRKTWPVQARDWATQTQNEYGENTAQFYGHQMMLMNLDVTPVRSLSVDMFPRFLGEM